MDGPPIHGNTRLEIIWTAIPAIMLVALCSYAYVVLTDIEEADGRTRSSVRVVGEQFTWTFYYQDAGRARSVASPQLYVPRGQPVQLHRPVQGRDPRLLGAGLPHEDRRRARDRHAAPRHAQDASASYPVVCAELCGLGHAAMRQTAHVVEPGRVRQLARRTRAPAAAGGGARRRGGAAAGSGRAPTARRSSRRQRLRRLPRARRRRHDRRRRARPRRGPPGQGRGVHRGVDRRPVRRDRRGLLGRASCRRTSATRCSRQSSTRW